MDSVRSRPPRGSAIEQFADWLAHRDGPGGIAFGDLLRAHPHWAGELEDLHATWHRLARASETFVEPRSAEAAEPSADDDRPGSEGPRASAAGRYRLEGEVARGGMGAILRVWDADLRRHLAMKVALANDGAPTATSGGDAATRLVRFLDEARVTSQLDHPGIVPVHELGLDEEGRHYFTMKLVEGRDLKRVFDLVFAAQEGWSETRALGVVEKVCEAMAYAHRKGVIHRDLKPANVMVGNFGEVFVMDWGLSRVLDREDLHDLRLVDAAAPAAPAATDAGGRRVPDDLASAHLVTMDGVVLGTPAYMPPEQARGNVDQLSPRSDVYSIGAMLYHLLARRVPYVEPGTQPPPREVLARVRAGPPKPVPECNPKAPAELVAICERAMARDPMERYADTLAFAGDLRAFLEHRVVAAYETGAVAELRKWVGRNRALAGALAAAIAILIAAVIVSSSSFLAARQESLRADAKGREAEEQRRLAAQRAEDVLSLSAAKDLQDLVVRANALWPAIPTKIRDFEQWLRDARALIDGRPADPERGAPARRGLDEHRRQLAELAARALPPDASSTETSSPANGVATPASLRFASGEDTWWYLQLGKLVADLEALVDPSTGLCSRGTSSAHGWGVERRLEEARTIEARSVAEPAAAARWLEAIASIADPASCPKYQGLRIRPQLGLLPIGRDAASGLWEFAHLSSGEPAVPGPDGQVVLHEGAGLVFVLIPGGTFWMGSQEDDSAGENYDPMSQPNETPVHEVRLDPWFLSKFEVTQDQWERFTGTNPSMYHPGSAFAGKRTTKLHPVEQIHGRLASTVLSRLGLSLPTEAQWEHAARAGTRSPWWTGSDRRSLQGAANLADGVAMRTGAPSAWPFETWMDDGHAVHARVGQFRANGFGLHDVCGNVFELCREGFGSYHATVRAGDGERQGTLTAGHVIRGGGYHSGAGNARSGFRNHVALTYFDFSVGLRPSRRVSE